MLYDLMNHSLICFIMMAEALFDKNLVRNITQIVKHPVSVMIWCCISWYSIGRLYICKKVVNQDEYLRILQTHLLLSINNQANKFGDFDTHNAIFQDDSAPYH